MPVTARVIRASELARVRACARACVCVYVCMCGRARALARSCVDVLLNSRLKTRENADYERIGIVSSVPR